MKKFLLAVLLAGIWVNISEFVRNELLIKNLWLDGFKQLGLNFPSAPVNGAVWGTWAFILVTVLAVLTTKFDALKSTLIAWVLGFVLFWLAFWNLGFLPRGLLVWAVPWSFIEVYIAALICKKIMN